MAVHVVVQGQAACFDLLHDERGREELRDRARPEDGGAHDGCAIGDVREAKAARPFQSPAMPHRELQPWNPVAVHLAKDFGGQRTQGWIQGRALDGGLEPGGPLGEREHFLHEEALQSLRLFVVQAVRRVFEPKETLATRRIEPREIVFDQNGRCLSIVAALEEEDRHLDPRHLGGQIDRTKEIHHHGHSRERLAQREADDVQQRVLRRGVAVTSEERGPFRVVEHPPAAAQPLPLACDVEHAVVGGWPDLLERAKVVDVSTLAQTLVNVGV